MSSVLDDIKKCGFNPIVIGSAGEEKIKNFSDYDVDIIIKSFTNEKNKIMYCLNKIKEKYFLIDIKVYYINLSKKVKSFDDIDFNKITKLKIDVVNIDNDFNSYEIVFKSTNTDEATFFKLLIKDLLLKKDYFKAIKRYLSYLRKSKTNYSIVDNIINFINSPVGKVGSLISKINDIKKVMSMIPEIPVINSLKNISNEYKKIINDIISKDKLIYFDKPDKLVLTPEKWLQEKSFAFAKNIGIF